MPAAHRSTKTHTYVTGRRDPRRGAGASCAAMYPRRDTAIRHYVVQPHCVILKQGECRSTHSAAPSGHTSCSRAARTAAPEQTPIVPGEELVGVVRDDRHRALASGCHSSPSPTGNNAGRSTTDRVRQGIARARKRRPARPPRPPTACYSIGVRAAGCGRPADACSQRKLAVRLRARERRVPARGGISSMQQNAAGESGSRSHSPAPHMQQDAACHMRRSPAFARGARECHSWRRARAPGLPGPREGLCADTHTPRIDGVYVAVRPGAVCPSQPDRRMTQARRGNRALIACVATC